MGGRRPVRAQLRTGDAAARGRRDGSSAGDDPQWARPNWSGPHSKHSPSIPTCWRPSAPASALLLVDDAQQLDPQAALLVRVLAAGAELTLLAGDPDQAVFGFRGAEPTVLLR